MDYTLVSVDTNLSGLGGVSEEGSSSLNSVLGFKGKDELCAKKACRSAGLS
jgi:hypothetical protein